MKNKLNRGIVIILFLVITIVFIFLLINYESDNCKFGFIPVLVSILLILCVLIMKMATKGVFVFRFRNYELHSVFYDILILLGFYKLAEYFGAFVITDCNLMIEWTSVLGFIVSFIFLFLLKIKNNR